MLCFLNTSFIFSYYFLIPEFFFTCQRSNIIFKLSFSFRVVGVLAAFAFSENTWSLLALLCTDFLPPKSLRHVALNSIKNTFYVQCRSLWLCTMTKYILTLDVMLTGAALNKKTPVYFFFQARLVAVNNSRFSLFVIGCLVEKGGGLS